MSSENCNTASTLFDSIEADFEKNRVLSDELIQEFFDELRKFENGSFAVNEFTWLFGIGETNRHLVESKECRKVFLIDFKKSRKYLYHFIMSQDWVPNKPAFWSHNSCGDRDENKNRKLKNTKLMAEIKNETKARLAENSKLDFVLSPSKNKIVKLITVRHQSIGCWAIVSKLSSLKFTNPNSEINNSRNDPKAEIVFKWFFFFIFALILFSHSQISNSSNDSSCWN